MMTLEDHRLASSVHRHNASSWARLALHGEVHGEALTVDMCKSRNGCPLGTEMHMLRSMEAAQWIERLHAAPSLSQRALALVSPAQRPTHAAAMATLNHELAVGADLRLSSYWWKAGPRAADGIAALELASSETER